MVALNLVTAKEIIATHNLLPHSLDCVCVRSRHIGLFVLKLIQELYYRIQLQEFEEIGEFGISDNAVATALFASSFDICLKGILTKIKNNKKFSHILITNNPKYNDDCVSIKLNSEVRINIFDIIYSFVSSKLKSKGDKYERTKQREQSEITD